MNLLVVCAVAFIAVFVLLALLAATMHLMTAVFPDRVSTGVDAAVVAAISTAVATLWPGARVTKIEEER